jgi:hypothetical protein
VDKLHLLRVSLNMDVTCVATDYLVWNNLTRNRNLCVLVFNTVKNLGLLKSLKIS